MSGSRTGSNGVPPSSARRLNAGVRSLRAVSAPPGRTMDAKRESPVSPGCERAPAVHGRAVRYRLGLPVDPSGDFFGRPFKDVREFKAILLEDRTALARKLARRLIVTATGALTDCKPVSEEPANLGFGQAALAAAEYMTMNPWSVDGDPLDGLRVTLPIRLQLVDETPGDAATPAP